MYCSNFSKSDDHATDGFNDQLSYAKIVYIRYAVVEKT